MRCPYCNHETEAGYINVDGLFGTVWEKEGEELYEIFGQGL